MELRLDDAYNGAQRQVNINGRKKVCSACKGTGAEGGKVKKCGHCGGQGQVSKPVRMGPMMVQMQQPCERCRGKGVIYKRACNQCGGGGLIENSDALDCNIEPGMSSGDELTFPGEADVDDPAVDAGDLKIRVKFDESDSQFERNADDLRFVEKISLKESLLGFKHQFQHMDGHAVEFGTTGTTQPYQVRKIEGEGMPIRHANSFGDMVIEHQVKFPNDNWVSKLSAPMPNQPDLSKRDALIKAFGGYPRRKAETLICAAPPCTID